MLTFPPAPASNSNTTTNNTQNPTPQITQMTLPSPSLSQLLSIKLDETNLLLWKNQLLNIIYLNSQLQQIKKIDIPLFEYLSQLKFVFDKFAAIGEPLSYIDKLIRILEGLPEEYDIQAFSAVCGPELEFSSS
ncbi:hypothetical protein AAG906_026121 [Vitis piasezkii]